MAQMYHTQNSQRSRPRWLGVTLAISVAAALVLFLPRLIGGIFPSAGASPPPGAAWPGTLTTGDQLRTAGTYTMFLPLLYNYQHAPLNCTPQVWYTFSSFGSTPMGMAYDVSRTRLFVANYAGPDAGSLAVINAGSGQKIRVVDDMPEAHDVAFDAKRNRMYVVGGIRLSVVDGASYSVWAKIPIGVNEPAGARAVAYNPTADKIYVAGFQDNSITIVNAATWSVITKLTRQEIVEPADIAANPVTNKVYVSNHNHGAPYGWVTVIDGNTNALLRSIPLSGDLYGIAVDSVHNLVYVTSISAARVYVIDGSTNTRIGDIQIVRAEDKRPMPLRMAAVNPSVGAETHLWLTSSSGDYRGRDRLILLVGHWPTLGQPRAIAVTPSPEGGLVFDPTSWYLFVSSMQSNLVTVSQDNASLCLAPLSLGADNTDSEGLSVIVNDYRHPQMNR